MASLYLVRLGQTDSGAGEDPRLFIAGAEQGRLAGQCFADGQEIIGRIITGALPHHVDAAAEISQRLYSVCRYTPELEVDPRLYESCMDDHFAHIARLHAQPGGVNGAGEGWPAVAEHARAVLRSLTARARPGEATIAVASGALIATITQQVLGLPDAGAGELFAAMKDYSISHFLHSGGRVSLSSFNDTTYLSALPDRC